MFPCGASCPLDADRHNRIRDIVGRSVCLDRGGVHGAFTTVSRLWFAVTSVPRKGSAYLTSAVVMKPLPQNEHE